jgi:hypothetical protein
MRNPLEPPFSWTCPFCNSTTTINHDDFSSESHDCRGSKHGHKRLYTYFIICPNPQCKEFSLIANLFDVKHIRSTDPQSIIGYEEQNLEEQWTIVPPYQAKIFPDYIPKPLLDDYYEACQIRERSPKAAATLARRCIQGMIRDFWSIQKGRLIDEIKELEGKVDSLTWEAIDAVRTVGNIGAHMEKDVNLVIDIEPDEANLLITLIETLLTEWYINRHERQTRIARVIEMGQDKTGKKSKRT